MPFYDYKCPTCDRTTEVFLKKARPDDALVLCKTCDSSMERQPSAPNFSVKGFNASNGYASSK